MTGLSMEDEEPDLTGNKTIIVRMGRTEHI